MMRWMMAVVGLLLAINNAAAQGEVPSVEVTAIGTVSMAPDQSVLEVAVETFGKQAEEASQENAKKMELLIDVLKKKVGIPKWQIQTVSYRLNPEYQHKNGKRSEEPVGYRAHNMVKVVVADIAKTGKAIDAAIGAGGNQVVGVHFQVEETEGAYLNALELAVETAKKRAMRMALAAGQKLGKVLSIHTRDRQPGPVRESMQMARAFLKADTPIESGQIEISASVTVRYALMKADN